MLYSSKLLSEAGVYVIPTSLLRSGKVTAVCVVPCSHYGHGPDCIELGSLGISTDYGLVSEGTAPTFEAMIFEPQTDANNEGIVMDADCVPAGDVHLQGNVLTFNGVQYTLDENAAVERFMRRADVYRTDDETARVREVLNASVFGSPVLGDFCLRLRENELRLAAYRPDPPYAEAYAGVVACPEYGIPPWVRLFCDARGTIWLSGVPYAPAGMTEVNLCDVVVSPVMEVLELIQVGPDILAFATDYTGCRFGFGEADRYFWRNQEVLPLPGGDEATESTTAYVQLFQLGPNTVGKLVRPRAGSPGTFSTHTAATLEEAIAAAKRTVGGTPAKVLDSTEYRVVFTVTTNDNLVVTTMAYDSPI